MVLIAFHTPLNPPDDARVSGDRQMARQLVAILTGLGHRVAVVGDARSYLRTPAPDLLASATAQADRRQEALLAGWAAGGETPDLWFTYHSYYKAPDLLGPAITRRLGIPYVVAEASDSGRRAQGEWAQAVALARDSFSAADLHLYFTRRDIDSVRMWCKPTVGFLALPPFIDAMPGPAAVQTKRAAAALVTVAMMRSGVKHESYLALAAALKRIAGLDWTLSIVGDGPMRAEVESAFAGLPEGRVRWLGAVAHADVGTVLAQHDLFVWPGLGEAYGLVYLEAQAAGLPVVAFDSGGVSATVMPDETALLTPERDEAAFARAVSRLLSDPDLRTRMGEAARRFVARERTASRAGEILAQGLEMAVASHAQALAGEAMP